MSTGGVAGYSATHARVRAMYATMLTPDVWARLCEAQSLDALIQVLKETVYGPYLSQVDEQALTPRRAVYQIKGHLADAFVSVIHMLPREGHALLAQLYRLFEVDNLKAVLRGIVSGASWDQVRYVLFPMGSFTVVPAQTMVEAGSVAGAVELLRGTPYHGTLTHAMERYTAEGSLFPLEVALDLDYWRALWRDVNQLSGHDREQARRIVGSLADLNNLMWAIRYRVYHHLSEEEIINYTLPIGYRVRDEDIRAIAAGADIAQVVTRIYPALQEAARAIEQEGGVSHFELQLQRQLVEVCRAAFVGYPFHVGVPTAYVLLNELEIQDITVLIEARSLALPPERFRPRLVFGCPSA